MIPLKIVFLSFSPKGWIQQKRKNGKRKTMSINKKNRKQTTTNKKL